MATTIAGLPIPEGTPAYLMTTTRGTRYVLAADGAVLARSDGPRGWRYSGQWIIRGAARRWGSLTVVPLAAIAAGADFGQGFIDDWDHGHRRRWGGEQLRSLELIGGES